MSTPLGGIEQLADPPRPNLQALLRNFDRDAARSKRLVRQWIEDDRGAFLRSALQVLKNNLESRDTQHLVDVLVAGGLLLPAISDLSLSRDTAVALAQAAGAVDPQIDVALARVLAEKAGQSDAAGVQEHVRLMEILAATSDAARIFPHLVRLLRHPNPHIRSKAVLMIGRANRSAKWVQQRLADTDPRIRANAAEALWGIDTAEARELLESLVHDTNNRVAGNAILGLYRLGDCSMIPELVAMARHESALFRATAAWAMGESGDPRFTEIVAGLLREPNAIVRKRSFCALGTIRAAVAHARQVPPCRLAARILDDPGKPSRRVLLGAIAGDGPVLPNVLPTQMLLNEDGHSIVQYRVTERPLPETMSIVFLFTRAGAAPATPCLRWKRPGDLWAGIYYSRDVPPGAAAVDCSPRFQSSAAAIATDWERIPPAADCGDLWRAVAAAVDLETKTLAGKRRLIVFSDPVARPPAGEDLIVAVAAAQAFVQVISSGPDPVMEDFCRRANGVFWQGGADSAVQAYLNLFTRYEVVYQPPKPDAQRLKIRLHGPELCAEAVLPIASPSPAGP